MGIRLKTSIPWVAHQPARVALLLLIIAIVVGVPVWVGLVSLRQPHTARALAAHAAEVQAQVLQLAREVRSMESQVFAQMLGVPSEARFDFPADSASVVGHLNELRLETRDNPAQQRRLDELQSLVLARLSVLDRARISEPEVARELIRVSNQLPSLTLLIDAIALEERSLALERQRVSNLGERRTRVVAIGGALAQAALLVTLLLLAERDRAHSARAAMATDVERGRALRVVEAVPAPIALLSPALEIVEANPAFRDLYGSAEQNVIGRPLAEIANGSWNDSGLLQRLGDVAQLGRELWDYDTLQHDIEQRERNMLLNARRLGTEQDDLVLLTAIDITATRRGDEQVRELNKQLTGKIEQVSEVNRELEAFSYSVSHDLRAPLRHIAAFAGKLDAELGAAATEKSRHYLTVIDESARRMSQLIDDLLVYSRLGRSALRILPVDMQSMVADVRAMLSSDLRAQAAQWDVGHLPVVEGDDNMLRTVWQNLLGNAVKYSSTSAAARIRVRAELDSNTREWVFSVADNGVGFDMAYIDKLFGVFQRLHKASEFPGTGIGLANVRRIVSRHQGRVWAEGAPGAGATFCFTLPAVER
ncbi:MAG: ATP-binding protein [Lysobacterales bacterium]